MNWFSIVIGLAAFLYGVYTLVLQFKAPEKFGKLEGMKKVWGDRAGYAIHLACYTLIPLVAGIFLLICGLRGTPLVGR